jgi:hypothetical protein
VLEARFVPPILPNVVPYTYRGVSGKENVYFYHNKILSRQDIARKKNGGISIPLEIMLMNIGEKMQFISKTIESKQKSYFRVTYKNMLA